MNVPHLRFADKFLIFGEWWLVSYFQAFNPRRVLTNHRDGVFIKEIDDASYSWILSEVRRTCLHRKSVAWDHTSTKHTEL